MRKALIAAVDAYQAPYTLNNSVNDANELKSILQSRGFSVVSLQNASATKTNILIQLRAMVQSAYAGDSICFFFAGHGGQMPSSEPDGTSECLCAYDWQSGGLVWDREIDSIIATVRPGVNCDLIYGCCFAGGISENPGTSIISWQACGELEYSYIMRMGNGSYRGLFSLFLCDLIRSYPTASRGDIYDTVAYWVQRYAPQHPVLRCTATERNQPMFS